MVSWTISTVVKRECPTVLIVSPEATLMLNLKSLATVALLSSFAFSATATESGIDISDLQASINAELEQSMTEMQNNVQADVISSLVADKETQETITTAEVRTAD